MAADLSNYWIGGAVLHALVLLAAGALFVAGLFLCRRRGDAARNVVRWLAIALFFFTLFTFLFMLYAAFLVVYIRTSTFGEGTMSVVSTLSYTFEIIAKTLVLAVLSSLARGILQAREGKRSKLAIPVAVVTYGLTAINTILAIASFGASMYFSFGDISSYSGFSSLALHVNRLSSVPMIFVFIGAVVSVAASGLVFFKVQSKFPTLKFAAISLGVASFLFFVSSLYEVVYIGVHVPLSKFTVPKPAPDFNVILRFFFSTVPAFLALALVFNVTRTKDKGLWTIQGGAPAGQPGFQQPPPMQQPGFQQPPPVQQPGFQQSQPVQQPGFVPGVTPQGPPPQGWAPQGQPQPGYYYPPQAVPGQAPAPQQGYGQYPVGQAPSPVPSPPQGQPQAQPHVTQS